MSFLCAAQKSMSQPAPNKTYWGGNILRVVPPLAAWMCPVQTSPHPTSVSVKSQSHPACNWQVSRAQKSGVLNRIGVKVTGMIPLALILAIRLVSENKSETEQMTARTTSVTPFIKVGLLAEMHCMNFRLHDIKYQLSERVWSTCPQNKIFLHQLQPLNITHTVQRNAVPASLQYHHQEETS